MSDEPPDGREYPRARTFALSLAWLKSGLILFVAIAMAALGGGQDPAGQAYLFGGFVMGSLYWLVIVLPALLVLRRATRRRVAAGLALLVALALLLAAWLA